MRFTQRDRERRAKFNEPLDRRVRDAVAQQGFIVIVVPAEDDEPSFGYTVGLSAVAHPELLVFGLPDSMTSSILGRLATTVLNNEVRYGSGDTVHDLFEEFPVRFIDVTDTGSFLTMANRLYYPDVTGQVLALQVVFPDSEHRWPWESDSAVAATPLVGLAPGPGEGTEHRMML